MSPFWQNVILAASMKETGEINVGHKQGELPGLYQLNSDRDRYANRQTWFRSICSTLSGAGSGVVLWETPQGLYLEEWVEGDQVRFSMLTPQFLEEMVKEFSPNHK